MDKISITFSLVLPDYLRQWLIFSMGGEPVRFPKGSALAAFLKIFLRHKRENDSPAVESADAVRIVIPRFPGKDPQYHNFLPVKARHALVDLIRDMFDVELFRDLEAFRNLSRKKSDIIEVWMAEHGIEICDRNWNAVAKRLQLLRARAYDRERKRSHTRK